MNRSCSYLWVVVLKESTVLIDTTVQEKNITYPTDAKLAIKIINRLAMNRSCSYLWVVVLILFGKTKNLFTTKILKA
jgi:hypothetical protein